MENKITITLDDEEIARLIHDRIAVEAIQNWPMQTGYTREVKKACAECVKELVYSQKDYIIEQCIARAAAELVRKGLPRLIERMP